MSGLSVSAFFAIPTIHHSGAASLKRPARWGSRPIALKRAGATRSLARNMARYFKRVRITIRSSTAFVSWRVVVSGCTVQRGAKDLLSETITTFISPQQGFFRKQAIDVSKRSPFSTPNGAALDYIESARFDLFEECWLGTWLWANYSLSPFNVSAYLTTAEFHSVDCIYNDSSSGCFNGILLLI